MVKEPRKGSWTAGVVSGVTALLFALQIGLAFSQSRVSRDRSAERLARRKAYFEQRIKGKGLRLHEARWYRAGQQREALLSSSSPPPAGRAKP